jgi:hypothetical protein
MIGWGRSADGPLLWPFSLLTAKFTRNFAKSWLLARQRREIEEPAQGVRRKFPAQRNRELFSTEQEIFNKKQEISAAN